MSFKYSRLFASTCLSFAAVGFLVVPHAQAGFDWVPPEKAPVETVVEAVPELVPTPAPEVSEAPAVEEGVEAIDEPEITIQVLDEAPAEADIVEEEIIEVVETIEDTKVELEEDVVVDVIQDDVAVSAEEVVIIEDEAEEISAPVEIRKAPVEINESSILNEIPEEVVVIEETEAPAEAPSNELTLDFNPGTDSGSQPQAVAILPDDTEQDISDVDIMPSDTVQAEPPAEDIFWAEAEKFDVIEGFGNDMPLALALRQIVPARYAFKFSEGVNAGKKVSWEGGKPWNDVLENALKPAGIDFVINRSTMITLTVSEQPVKQEEAAASIPVTTQDEAAPKLLAEEEQVVIEVPYASETKEEAASAVVEIVEEIEGIEDSESDVVDQVVAAEETIPDVEESPSPLDEIYGEINKLEQDVVHSDVSEFTDVGHSDGLQSSEISAPVLDQKKNEIDDLSDQNSITKKQSQESINWNDVPAQNDAVLDDKDAKLIDADTPAADAEIEAAAHDASSHDMDFSEFGEEEIIVTSSLIEDSGKITSEVIDTTVESLDQISPAAHDTASYTKDIPAVQNSFRSIPSGDILVWEARKGANVKRVLEKWAKLENIDFTWTGSEKYTVDKDVFISGTFGNAVEILLDTSVKHAPNYTFVTEENYSLLIDAE